MSETYFKTLQDLTGAQAIPYVDRVALINSMIYSAEVFMKPITGAAALIDVPLPFDPAFAILINETAGPTVFLGSSGKAAATAISIILATALVAANGFTFTPKVGSTPAFLRLGTALQTTSDVCHLIVFGMQKNPSV